MNAATTAAQLPALDPTQALRIIAGVARFQDVSSSGKLQLLGSNAALYSTTGNPLRAWAPGLANFTVGLAGITFGWIDDEFVFGTDYLEILAASDTKGSFKVIAACDVTNTDGAATHSIGIALNLLVEIYQRTVMPR